LFGWTLGGGLDYMLLAGWSLDAEYRFTRFDRDDNFSLGTLPLTPTTSTPITGIITQITNADLGCGALLSQKQRGLNSNGL